MRRTRCDRLPVSGALRRVTHARPGDVGASGGIDPLYPTLGNGGYDVGRYDIAIEADPATNGTTIGVRVDADPSRAAGIAALFSRGALSLHALRRVVGDETFFDILRTWVERFYRDVATVDDFVALAEEVAGRQLDEWEMGWLRGEPVPPRTELGLPAD